MTAADLHAAYDQALEYAIRLGRDAIDAEQRAKRLYQLYEDQRREERNGNGGKR